MDEVDTKCFRCRRTPTVVDVGEYEGCGCSGAFSGCSHSRGVPSAVDAGGYERSGCEGIQSVVDVGEYPQT